MTHVDFLQSGNKQMSDFAHLAERKSGNWAGALMQGQSFTVPVPGDVTLGQNHAAIGEACKNTQSSSMSVNTHLSDRSMEAWLMA